MRKAIGALEAKTITIKGLTHKMKNRVREHGNIWIIINESEHAFMITPMTHFDKLEPYCVWVIDGKDCLIS